MEAPQVVSPLRIAFLVGSLLCLSLSWMVGCSRAEPAAGEEGAADDVSETSSRRENADATVRLAARPGSGAHGFVRLIETDEGIRLIAELAGMPPGPHGFHVHEKGDCSAPDFSSAGEHFATAGHEAHGMPADAQRHTGDLGNIVVDSNGTASLDRKDEIISLKGDRSIVGRAVIVHEMADNGADAKSAGGRLLCGVVERADLGALPERNASADVPKDASAPTQAPNNTIPPLTPPPPLVP